MTLTKYIPTLKTFSSYKDVRTEYNNGNGLYILPLCKGVFFLIKIFRF